MAAGGLFLTVALRCLTPPVEEGLVVYRAVLMGTHLFSLMLEEGLTLAEVVVEVVEGDLVMGEVEEGEGGMIEWPTAGWGIEEEVM